MMLVIPSSDLPAFYGSRGCGPASYNITRDPNGVVVVVQLPGFSKSEVSVEVHNKELVVTAQKAPQEKTQQDPSCSRLHVCERRGAGARYTQTFRLGDNVAVDAISANMEHGVLTITLPYKTEQQRAPRRVPVEGPPSPPASPPAGPADDDAPGPSSRPAPPAPEGGWVDVAAADDGGKGKAPADDDVRSGPGHQEEEEGMVEDVEY